VITTADRAPAVLVSPAAADLQIVLIAESRQGARRIAVEAGHCLVGSGDFCDLQIADPVVPLAHSEIHVEDGVVWIETADDHELDVNGRSCRRLALRDGDRVRVGETSLTIRINPPAEIEQTGEDISRLSAFELCERIEGERAAITDFERRRLTGWETLLRQVEDVIQHEPAATWEQDSRIESVVLQLHALADKLAERTRELAAQEALFMESAGELKHAQDLMTSRLERVLQQFQDSELRASA